MNLAEGGNDFQHFQCVAQRLTLPSNTNFRDVRIYELLNGLFCAGAVLISYGAVLGKTTPSQLVVLCFLEPFFYWLNNFVILMKVQAFDAGTCIKLISFEFYI